MALPLSARPQLNAEELKILIDKATPGKHDVALTIGSRPSGAPLQLPVTVVRGTTNGPRGAVISGVHGDEAPGPEGARAFLAQLTASDVSGTVVVCPLVNLPGFEHRSRTSVWDGVDLVRIWPGDSAGTLTHRTAAAVVDGLIDGAHFLVDLHSGTTLIHEAWVIYANPMSPSPEITTEVANKSREMAIAFGTDQILRQHPWRTTISGIAPRGIPTILAEIGGGPDCHRHLPQIIERMVEGLNNVLRTWDMLEADTPFPGADRCVEFDIVDEIKAQDGSGHWMRRVESGDPVDVGTVVGAFVDPITGDEQAVTASAQGVILNAMVTWPQVDAGQWLMAVGREVATHQRGLK